jgi:hypothetical protein
MDVRNLNTLSCAGMVLAWLAASVAAQADHQPVIAIPGNVQVPVIIDGVDASGALVYGDFGLYAPGRIPPQIVGPTVMPVEPYGHGYYPNSFGYYPRTGRQPRYGRQEIDTPPRALPPAPSYHREWSASSGPGQVTTYPPYAMPDVNIDMGDRRERMPRQPRERRVR